MNDNILCPKLIIKENETQTTAEEMLEENIK